MSIPKTTAVLNKETRAKIRENLAEALLVDRLELDEEWLDLDTPIYLPEQLPEDSECKMSATDRRDLTTYLDNLVRLGCQRQVLYWCLQDLGARADNRRLGKVPPTREDMGGFIHRVQDVTDFIRRNRDELLMASDALAGSHSLPHRVSYEVPTFTPEAMLVSTETLSPFLNTMEVSTDEPVSAADAVQDLLDSLRWVKGLAESWQAPNLKSLVKAKGVLPLIAYVWIHTKKMPKPETPRNHAKRLRKTKTDRLSPNIAVTVSCIVHVYCGIDHDPANLIDKLQDFQHDHPALFIRLVSKLRSLDAEVAGTRHAVDLEES